MLCRTLRFFAHHAGASLIFTKHKDNLSKHLLRNLLGYHVFGNIKVRLPGPGRWPRPNTGPRPQLIIRPILTLTCTLNVPVNHLHAPPQLEVGQMQLSHMSPLFVPVGADSFKGIGNPPTVPGCLSDAMADKWRAVFEEIFPPRKAKREAQADLTMVEAEQARYAPPNADLRCGAAPVLPCSRGVVRFARQFAEEAIDELRRQKREELVKMRKAAVFEAKMTAEMSSSTSAKPVS